LTILRSDQDASQGREADGQPQHNCLLKGGLMKTKTNIKAGWLASNHNPTVR